MKAHVRASIVTFFVLGISLALYFGLRSQDDSVDKSIGAYQSIEATGLPLFAFSDFTNATRNTEEFKKGTLIVTFWASWCAPCVEEFPSFVRLLEKRPQIRILAISGDYKKEEIDKFLKTVMSFRDEKSKKAFYESFTITWDEKSEYRKIFGVMRLPEAFVFHNGQLERKIVGAIDWGNAEALQFFDQLK